MLITFISIACFCLPNAMTGDGVQDSVPDILELALNSAVVMTDEIDLHGPEYRSIRKAAAEGKTFLVIDVKMKFSRTDMAVFFDQIALVTADAKKIQPAYFAPVYDPTHNVNSDAFPAGEGTGGFMKKVPGGMKVAFVYLNGKKAVVDPDRWGLGFKFIEETVAFIFEIDKTEEGVLLSIGNKELNLKEPQP